MTPTRSQTRVIVTGIGLITGLGGTTESTWSALREGKRAVRAMTLSDGSTSFGCPSSIDFDSNVEPALILLEKAADQALSHANLDPTTLDLDRVGVLAGLSKGGLRNLSRVHHAILRNEDPQGEDWLNSRPSSGASSLARRIGSRGPSLAPIAACATGLIAVAQGADLIRRDVVDVVLAGASDASLEPLVLAAFQKMKVLARVDLADPSSAIRPWDRARSGFLVGEGAAVLVLENLEHARRRGVAPIVEIAGGALGADAFHETALNPDPRGLAGVIGRALDWSHIKADELDYVNVHGTATRSNDPLECQALRLALGTNANRIVCSANKAQIGHLLGAAGAAELAITCLAIRDSFAPPTLNLLDQDPECDLVAVPFGGRSMQIRAALKLSIGFGGHFAALCLQRIDRS